MGEEQGGGTERTARTVTTGQSLGVPATVVLPAVLMSAHSIVTSTPTVGFTSSYLNSPLVLVLYPRSPPVQVRAFFHCTFIHLLLLY